MGVSSGKAPTLFWFDRFDERVGLLPVAGEMVHIEELNGQDTIEFATPEVVQKGDRILWLDGSEWREHVVVRTDQTAPLMTEVYAESSLCEMLSDFIEEEHLVSRTARHALGRALAPTRWEVESCEVYSYFRVRREKSPPVVLRDGKEVVPRQSSRFPIRSGKPYPGVRVWQRTGAKPRGQRGALPTRGEQPQPGRRR